MAQEELAFPSRLLALGGTEAGGSAPKIDKAKINKHIEGRADGKGVMKAAEIAKLLNDPFATLVLRKGTFPKNLGEVIAAIDKFNGKPEGLPDMQSYLVSEGGQIPFAAGLNKGGTRLITARFRNSSPELMTSTLLPPGTPARTSEGLNEVLAWDPVNRTFHFYQRQQGAWFWCGQSDMALEDATRGKGPFDSHINGYPNMKELKTPWVHWHGPGLGISESAYAPDDPLVKDSLFTGRDNALNFEIRVVRPLAERWNQARFDKAVKSKKLTRAPLFMRQVLEATSVNLITTHTEFTNLANQDLDDLPPSFFFDQEGLVSECGVPVAVPPLRMTSKRYRTLIKKHNLRVKGGNVDRAGDVPFCFLVPERAMEDIAVVRILIQRGAMTSRLAASLLMVDFPNPVGSSRRAALLKHVPSTIGLTAATSLDAVMVPMLLKTAKTAGATSPEAEFARLWAVGPDNWPSQFADRVEAFLGKVVAKLETDAGCDEIFRLAESRRREFRKRKLAEFDLTTPVAVGIQPGAKSLVLTEAAALRQRT